MKCFNILLFSLIYSNFLLSQNVEVLKKADPPINLKPRRSFDLCFIDTSFDTGKLKFIATIKVTEENSKGWGTTGFGRMYWKLQLRARKMGVNAFKLNSFFYSDSSKFMSITLDTYFASDNELLNIKSKKEQNVLYVLPAYPRYLPEDNYSFKLNGVTIKLEYRQYFKYWLKIGEKVLLSKGNSDEHFLGKPNQTSIFLSFSGCCVFNPPLLTGTFNYEENGFGELLINTIFKTPITLKNNP
jgi:hypothetical protein